MLWSPIRGAEARGVHAVPSFWRVGCRACALCSQLPAQCMGAYADGGVRKTGGRSLFFGTTSDVPERECVLAKYSQDTVRWAKWDEQACVCHASWLAVVCAACVLGSSARYICWWVPPQEGVKACLQLLGFLIAGEDGALFKR